MLQNVAKAVSKTTNSTDTRLFFRFQLPLRPFLPDLTPTKSLSRMASPAG